MTARATAAEGGGGLVAVFHPSPLILAARAASTSANDCQTVTDPRRHSSRLTIIHLAPLPRLDAGPADKKIMDRHDRLCHVEEERSNLSRTSQLRRNRLGKGRPSRDESEGREELVEEPIFRGILFANTIMETIVVFPVERAKSRKKPKRINKLNSLERNIRLIARKYQNKL